MTSETDPLGNTTTFTYDSNNDLTSYTDANGNTTSYAYNSSNDLLSITYANGDRAAVHLQPAGRGDAVRRRRRPRHRLHLQRRWPGHQESFADGSSYTYTYDDHGNISTATDPSGTITLHLRGREQPDLLTEVEYPDGTYLKFTYNVVGQRTQSVDQTGFTVNYTYDSVGRLSELTDGSGNLIVQYTYDAAGNLIQKDMGNGTRTVYTYDADGDVLSITNYAPDHTTVNSFDDYTYDASGNVLTDTSRTASGPTPTTPTAS